MSRFQSNNCIILETKIMNTAGEMPFVHIIFKYFLNAKSQLENLKHFMK